MKESHKNAAAALATALVGRGLTFVSTYFLNGILGKADFGNYAYVVSSVTTATSLGAMGTGQTSVTSVAANLANPAYIVRTIRAEAILIAIASTAVLTGLFAYYVWFRSTSGQLEHTIEIPIIATCVIAATYGSLFQGVLTGYRAYANILTVSVSAGIVFLCSALLLAKHHGYLGAIIGYTLYCSVQTGLLIYLVSRRVQQNGEQLYGGVVKGDVAAVFRVSAPILAGSTSVSLVSWLSITALLQSTHGSGAVAEIFIALQWKNLVLFIPTVFNQLLLERLSRPDTNSGNSLNRIVRNGIIFNSGIAAILAIALSLFASTILSLYGQHYGSAAPSFALMMITGAINSASGSIGKIFISRQESSKYLYADLIWSATIAIGLYAILEHGPMAYALVHAFAALFQVTFQLLNLRPKQP